ncbi:serine/arginine-rich splicing factor SR45 isoform X2 [Tanacetum coccineum]
MFTDVFIGLRRPNGNGSPVMELVFNWSSTHVHVLSSCYRKSSPIPESLVLHIGQLTRNVNENHLREIFGNFGEVVHVRLAMDPTVNLPRGSGYVEFKTRSGAEKGQLHMDGAQIDGKVVQYLRGRRSPIARRGSPPPRRRSPPFRRDDSPPPRRRPWSPSLRGHSPSPLGRRYNSSPRLVRSPPIRRPIRSPSSSISPRRVRPAVGRRGRSPSLSDSPSPRKVTRKVSRSRSPRRPMRRRSSSNGRHGGFDKVYKGTISNGESRLVVAIKRLDSTSNQGAQEFWAEVEMLSKLRQCHLNEMFLVYEYMLRGTLEDHLH